LVEARRLITRCGRTGPSADDGLSAVSGEFESLYSHLGSERLLLPLRLRSPQW
jgi:hypothetical protein